MVVNFNFLNNGQLENDAVRLNVCLFGKQINGVLGPSKPSSQYKLFSINLLNVYITRDNRVFYIQVFLFLGL